MLNWVHFTCQHSRSVEPFESTTWHKYFVQWTYLVSQCASFQSNAPWKQEFTTFRRKLQPNICLQYSSHHTPCRIKIYIYITKTNRCMFLQEPAQMRWKHRQFMGLFQSPPVNCLLNWSGLYYGNICKFGGTTDSSQDCFKLPHEHNPTKNTTPISTVSHF